MSYFSFQAKGSPVTHWAISLAPLLVVTVLWDRPNCLFVVYKVLSQTFLCTRILSNGYCYFHFCKWGGEAFLIEITESQDSNSGVLKSLIFFPPEKFSVMELPAKHVSDLRCVELLTFFWFFWRIIKWMQMACDEHNTQRKRCSLPVLQILA